MMGGPLGALLGGAIGSSMTREPTAGGARHGFPGGVPRSAEDMQMVFAVALTSLAAKVAKADGEVTREEIDTFDRFLSQSLQTAKWPQKSLMKLDIATLPRLNTPSKSGCFLAATLAA